MRKGLLLMLVPLVFSCGGQKPVKVEPQRPSQEEVAFQKELSKLKQELRKDYEEFIKEAYRIQNAYEGK